MAATLHSCVLLAVLVVCSSAHRGANAQQQQQQHNSDGGSVVPQTASYGDGARPGSSADTPAKYTMEVAVGTLDPSPDCFVREVILVNGAFMPSLELTQGDWVEITVKNRIPRDYPAITDGITIHWHGFSLHGFPWFDGTRFVSHCPIPRGGQFTYKFQVNEMPGTYFWHDHAAMYRADGLQGPLIVRERPGTPPLTPSDGESTLLLLDWWHFPGNSLMMRLSRPFDPSKATNGSGQWCWVGVPKAVLINGRGNYWDCEDVYQRKVGAPLGLRPAGQQVAAQAKDLMQPTPCIAGQLGPAAEQPACNVTQGAAGPGAKCARQRAEVAVAPGATHRVRLVNAGMLVYLTVCFERHHVTVVALDAAPVTPKTFYECVDVNTGQRVDVLLKADQPAGSFWISVGSQYRKGAPSGYAVLRYKGSRGSPDPDTIMQPGTAAARKWNTRETMAFTTPEVLLNLPSSSSASAGDKAAAAYVAPAVRGRRSWRLPKRDVDRRFILQSTQPLIEENGVLRWALGNVAHSDTPPCRSMLSDVQADARWAAAHALTRSAAQDGAGSSPYWSQFGGPPRTWRTNGDGYKVVDQASANANVRLDLRKPNAGTHVISIDGSQPLVEIVIQNDRAGLYGGEYDSKNASLTSARTGREQHSFHQHGYHVWLVGMGMGEWRPDKVGGPEYNLVNPPLRDTVTVLFNGTTEDRLAWVAFRFVADNPGVWPLHCHIAWHQLMGQGLNVIVDAEALAKTKEPPFLPVCRKPCYLDFANFGPRAVEEVYGGSGEARGGGGTGGAGVIPPELSNLP